MVNGPGPFFTARVHITQWKMDKGVHLPRVSIDHGGPFTTGVHLPWGSIYNLTPAIRGVTRTNLLQNIEIRENTSTPESIRDVIRRRLFQCFFFGGGHLCQEITSLVKHSSYI